MSLWDAGRPRCAEDAGNSNISYSIGRRTYEAGIYPVKAPNGSSIVVHAHERGLSFAWRGGRALQRQTTRRASQQTPTRQENQDEDVHMDGEDAEEESSAPKPNRSPNEDAEKEEEEVVDDDDLLITYPRIRRSLDLPLGSPPLHIAFPPLSGAIRAYDDSASQTYHDPDFPSLFHQDLVVATTCQDSSIHVIRVHLQIDQGSSGSEGKPNYEDIVISIPVPNLSPRKVPNSVSLTWTLSMSGRKNIPRTARSGPANSGTSGATSWTLLVATTSAETHGMLKVYGIPLVCMAGGTDIDAEGSALLRSEHLSIQPRKASFKPTTYPAKHHSHLLMTDVGGNVRLYDAMSRSKSTLEANGSLARGRWLTSLRASSESSSASLGGSRILDAAWAMSGTCVVVLFASGHWGVWDIEGVGPTASGGLLRGMSSGSSLSGAGVTPFALKGFIGSMLSSKGDRTSRESDGQSEQPTHLAPMTPNTRKSKQGRLFSQDVRSAVNVPTGVIVQGGISVMNVPNKNTEARLDSSVVFWYKDEVYLIQSLHNYWQRAVTTSTREISKRADAGAEETLFGQSLSPVSMTPPQGEIITSLCQSPLERSASSTVPSTILSELMISTESRITFVQPQRNEVSTAERDLQRLFMPSQTSAGVSGRPTSYHLDQDLLSRGELDLGGMDRMLNGMNGINGTSRHEDPFTMSGALQPASRRVGFAPNA